MVIYSKILPYTCYELGHTWHHSCTVSTLHILISAALESARIYGIVYSISLFISLLRKKITRAYLKKTFMDYLQSVCFLTVNGFGFIGSFCILRHIFQNINFLSASWLPAALASYFAILVERPSRRSMLALYVTNVASDSLFKICVKAGVLKPIPHGSILLFVISMAIFGYFFKKKSKFSPLVESILHFFVGKDEKNVLLKDHSKISPLKTRDTFGKRKHSLCLHKSGCIEEITKTVLEGAGKGFMIHSLLKVISSLPKMSKKPSILFSRLFSRSALRMTAFVAFFSASFKTVCCILRWLRGYDDSLNGSLAGIVAGMSIFIYPMPTLALYSFWKAIEALYERGCDKGYLPRIPYGIELLYVFSTAFIFHAAVFHPDCVKTSYWNFMLSLTAGKMGTYNRILLEPYELGSGKKQIWPSYDERFLSENFKLKFSKELTGI